jgi:transcriptional activator SPT7
MATYSSLSLIDSGSDKGKAKAKDILSNHQAPPWFTPGSNDDEDTKVEGAWWGFMSKDEAFTSGLPVIPMMAPTSPTRSRVVQGRKRRKTSPVSDKGVGTCFTDSSATLVDEPLSLSMTIPKTNGHLFHTSPTPLRRKPINLTTKIHSNVDKLFDIRKTVNQIQDWQKAENEGLPLPIPRPHIEREARRQEIRDRQERKRCRKEERVEARKRARIGGEVGEEEAALGVRAATASMLAQAGFDGMWSDIMCGSS